MDYEDIFNCSYHRIISGGHLDSLFTEAVNRVFMHPESRGFYADKDCKAITSCLKIGLHQLLGLAQPTHLNTSPNQLIGIIAADLLPGVCNAWEECILAAVAECDLQFNEEVKAAWITMLQPGMDSLRNYKTGMTNDGSRSIADLTG